ncbi:MAG: Beta-galactosidase C-terminal domain, partial [Oscillospiraceae bacterium]
LIRPTTCEVLSTYDSDFYAGMPALTRNRFGSGTAYHLCAITDVELCRDLYRDIDEQLHLEKAMETEVPYGVSLTYRQNENGKIVFVQNFGENPAQVKLDGEYTDLLTDEALSGSVNVDGFGCKVILGK